MPEPEKNSHLLERIRIPGTDIAVYAPWIYCAQCSLPFSTLGYFIERRMQSGRVFYCPNGHRNRYNPPAPPSPPADPPAVAESKQVKMLKRQIAKLLHEREQAEAKNASGSTE